LDGTYRYSILATNAIGGSTEVVSNDVTPVALPTFQDGLNRAVAASSSSQGWPAFQFIRKTNMNSELDQFALEPGPCLFLCWPFTGIATRAGSGSSTDPCAKGAGWIPPGTYGVREHTIHKDDTIAGRTWWLTDAQCSSTNATVRDELFIHSEETSAQGQTCTSASDDPYCWEGEFDYKSNGCIKLSHGTAAFSDDIGRHNQLWFNNLAVDHRTATAFSQPYATLLVAGGG